jgi:predicted house-cleaning noncanonical NTP pyrophosphatase (MazG superfamily)
MAEYQKLVRDRVPDSIRKNGEWPVTRVLSPEEFRLALRQKLVEEATEVVAAESRDEVRAELADLLEIIESICQEEKISQNGLLEERMIKNNLKGGFKKRIFLERVEDQELKEG